MHRRSSTESLWTPFPPVLQESNFDFILTMVTCIVSAFRRTFEGILLKTFKVNLLKPFEGLNLSTFLKYSTILYWISLRNSLEDLRHTFFKPLWRRPIPVLLTHFEVPLLKPIEGLILKDFCWISFLVVKKESLEGIKCSPIELLESLPFKPSEDLLRKLLHAIYNRLLKDFYRILLKIFCLNPLKVFYCSLSWTYMKDLQRPYIENL